MDGDVIRYWRQQSQISFNSSTGRSPLDSLLGVATGFATGRFATVITMALPQQPLGSYWESLLLFATGRQWESSLVEPDHDHDECGSDGSSGRAAQTH